MDQPEKGFPENYLVRAPVWAVWVSKPACLPLAAYY